MFPSGRSKPVITVGIPSPQAPGRSATTRPHGPAVVSPPRRARTRPAPAGSRAHPAGLSPATRSTSARPRRRLPRAQIRGATARRQARSRPVLTGRQPDRHVRLRADRQHRLLEHGLSTDHPVDGHGRLGPRARIELLGSPRVRGACSTLLEQFRPRSELVPSANLLFRRCGHARAERLGQQPVLPGRTARSVCINASVELSAAPPNTPEWRSRSPVRIRTWK